MTVEVSGDGSLAPLVPSAEWASDGDDWASADEASAAAEYAGGAMSPIAEVASVGSSAAESGGGDT